MMPTIHDIFPRPTRSPRAALRFLTSTILTLILLEALYNIIYSAPSHRIQPRSPSDPTYPPVGSAPYDGKPRPKVFIASIHRNNAPILSSHWSEAVLKLVDHLGPNNVYFSTYESGSLDDTKERLAWLEKQLALKNVKRTVILDPIDQLAEVGRQVTQYESGWIFTGRGSTGWEIRRIPYLANLRNKVMQPFYESEIFEYDYILWLNDVVFTTEDVLTLLGTRDGKFDAACALDFADRKGQRYYDTFALRDAGGEEALRTWPFFIDGMSRAAVKANEPVPVKSCWNGMVALRALPSYVASKAVKYRGAEDSLAVQHVEGSECCFIHVDLSDFMQSINRKTEGVWVNPNVRVGFNAEAYEAANPFFGRWPGAWPRVVGTWKNRLYRWFGHWRRKESKEKVAKRVEEWVAVGEQKGDKRREVGEHCLIDEMQVLFEAGWQHID